MKKRISALLLTLCMVIGMIPGYALAVDEAAAENEPATMDVTDVMDDQNTDAQTAEEIPDSQPADIVEAPADNGENVGDDTENPPIEGTEVDEMANIQIELTGKEAVRLGNNIYMHAVINGVGLEPIEGVRVNWYVDGKRIKAASLTNQTIKDGTKFNLKTPLSKSTTRELNKVTIKLSKKGCTTMAASAEVETIFDFKGAKLTPSKLDTVAAGKTRRVKMTLSGMKKPITGTVTWYVNNQKKETKKNVELANGKTFVYSLTTKKSETGTKNVKIVLTSADGKRSLTNTKSITVLGQYGKLISSYSTRFDPSQRGRSTNLRLAMAAINGTVIQPGGVFSYNGVVGERTAARGYQIGYVYSNGRAVPGIGGGVCQVSSTLFNTALLANMGIVERRCHSLTVSYVPLGRDATVLWGSQDFKFKNTSKYPVKIIATYDAGGKLTVNLMSSPSFKVPKVNLTVSRSGGQYTLRRSVNGKVNYTTYSSYAPH